MTLGETIRSARQAAGLSLRDLAGKLELSAPFISDVELDRRVPSEKVLQRIAAELELDFNLLMALGGRWGEGLDRYMRSHPSAGLLLQRIIHLDLSERQIQAVIRHADRIVAESLVSK